VTLSEGNQDELVAGLETGRFEIALLYANELPRSLHLNVLVKLHPYVLLPERHPLAKKKRLSLVDLAAEPLVLLDIPPGRGYFLGLFESLGITPNVSFTSSSFEMVRGMVGSGAGYSVLITRPQSDRTYDGQVVKACTITDATPPALVALARLPQARPTRLAECFVEFCEQAFAKFDRDRRWLAPQRPTQA
jgi:DNA-binding transcriptional LysR family regulator